MSTAFRVLLEGSQEVPPNGSAADGLGTVIFDSVATTASYSIRIDGLDFGPATGEPPQTPATRDDVTNMHVHNAPRGVNGMIVFGQIGPAQDNDDLSILPNPDGSWTVSGIWETTDPANVSLANFAAQLEATPIGADAPLYFNVHTVRFPGGAIRGQWVAIADDEDNVVNGTPDHDLLPGLGGNDVISAFAGNDTVQGGDGDDVLSGGDGDDNINMGLGNDTTDAGAGNDTVRGFAGRDVVFAGDGDDDLLWNDTVGDLVFGGGGQDRIVGADVVTDTIHGDGGDDVIRGFATQPGNATAGDLMFGDEGNDNITGGNGADSIHGGDGNDIVDAGGGNDSVEGAGGRDRLQGGAGRDTLDGGENRDTLSGGAGNDSLRGGAGADELSGDAGRDTLDGGAAADRLIGGLGRDVLTGGSGGDRFILTSVADSGASAGARDRILDFQTGTDRIDLSAIDADQTTGGNQAFDFIGTDPFTAAGQVRFFQDMSNRTIVEGNVDGDLTPEFQIELVGLHNLTAGNFVL